MKLLDYETGTPLEGEISAELAETCGPVRAAIGIAGVWYLLRREEYDKAPRGRHRVVIIED